MKNLKVVCTCNRRYHDQTFSEIMQKKLFYFLFGFVLTAATFSCRKTYDLNENTKPGTQTAKPSNARTTTETDEQVAADFNYTIENAVETSVAELFTAEYQESAEFAVLADASAAILQQAGLLNGYMNELNITNHYDARLVLAAKIISDLYAEGFPTPDNFDSHNLWKCLLGTLGIPAKAVVDVMSGMTMAEIGTVVGAMGSRWLITQLVKVGAASLTGWGAAIAIGSFTYCMIKSDEDIPGMDEVPQFVFPPDAYRTYTEDEVALWVAYARKWYRETQLMPGQEEPFWTAEATMSVCESFYNHTMAKTGATHAYHKYYLCAEPGFMDRTRNLVLQVGLEIPEVE